jgi:hypothetical protein
LERIAALKAQKVTRIVQYELGTQAQLLGRKGGLVKSERKARTSRMNARGGPEGKGKKAGRKPIYHFQKIWLADSKPPQGGQFYWTK